MSCFGGFGHVLAAFVAVGLDSINRVTTVAISRQWVQGSEITVVKGRKRAGLCRERAGLCRILMALVTFWWYLLL